MQIARRATDQLRQLVDRTTEGVTALERTSEGWRVEVEVVETARVPNTTDILAVYEVDLDSRGNLVGYTRTRRYLRGRQDGDAQ